MASPPGSNLRFHFLPLICLGSVLVTVNPASAQWVPTPAPTSSLKRLSLEELMELEVVSVSRHGEKLSEAPSAIRVITGEDVRRAGAETLPQALRLASNLHVAQVSSSYWTIGARGMNTATTTSNKLLVMIDGRSVYTPLFSGTYWDAVDVFLPDLDRIEVISGPGGSAWGANAVNGVINILTRDSAETQGTLVYGGAGGEARALGGVRHGGTLGRSGHYRVYAKHLDFNGAPRVGTGDAANRWVFSQAGFRSDFSIGGGSGLTVQGDLYTGWIQQATSSRGEFDGGNLLARWTVPTGADGTLTAKAYYDSARRGAPNTFADRIDKVDVDVQHDVALADGRARLVWGAGHRQSEDAVRNLPTQAFIPAEFTHRLTTAFVHAEYDLVPARWRLTLGSRYDHTNYSGGEHQPNVRLAWLAATHQTLWLSASRAVRTPSRVDKDFHLPPQPPFAAAGGPNFRSEILWGYELGWRGRLGERTSASLVAFHHDYDGLRTLEPPTPLQFANGLDARTYGTELFVRHEWSEAVSLTLGYTFFQSDFRLKPWSRDFNRGQLEIADPEHQVQLRTAIDLGRRWEADLGLRHVAAVATFGGGVLAEVPPYTELDARLGWQVREGLELSLIGTSLLDPSHPETGPANTRREIERSVHGRIVWRF